MSYYPQNIYIKKQPKTCCGKRSSTAGHTNTFLGPFYPNQRILWLYCALCAGNRTFSTSKISTSKSLESHFFPHSDARAELELNWKNHLHHVYGPKRIEVTLCDWLSLTSKINRCAKQVAQWVCFKVHEGQVKQVTARSWHLSGVISWVAVRAKEQDAAEVWACCGKVHQRKTSAFAAL